MTQQIIGGKYIANYPDLLTGELKPAVGYKLYTYVSGTLTLQATHSDAGLTAANENPITLDTRGEASVFLTPGATYTLVLKSATGTTIYTRDGIIAALSPSDISGTTGAGLLGFLYAAVYGAGTVGKWLQDLATSAGSTFMGFIQSGTGAVVRPVQEVLRENHSCLNFYLAAESTSEGMINRAITAHNRVHLPAGIYSIDTAVGIKVRTGTVITGDGMNKTVLSALLGSGGSTAELAAYTAGSVIKREFNPAGPNDYVNDVYMSDFSVLLNHPLATITTTKKQIGFDMRNITLSTIDRCHSGNIPTVGGPVAAKVAGKEFLVQGYPVVFGNVSGVDPAYAGGESNRILNSYIAGGYKCVIQDDPALSGPSASYGTIVQNCKIETGHWLIGQMGQYGAGNVHWDNSLQDIVKQSGDASSSYVQYYDGFNNNIRPAYIEAGSNVDYQLYLDADANNNKISMLMASVTSGAGAITDAGGADSYNRITHHGVAGTGALVEMYNKALMRAWVKFHWDGGAIVVDGSLGVLSVTRSGVGDYIVTWLYNFPTDDYNLTATLDTNVSTNLGGCVIRSHAASNVRVDTFTQVAGVTTQIDPRFVWVGANQ